MSVYYEQGRYRLRIIGACLGESKANKPQIEIGVEILSHQAKDGCIYPMAGPPRTVYLALSDETMGTPEEPKWVFLTLLDLGFVGPRLSDLAPLVGQEREGECKVEEYNGKWSEKWSIYRQRGTEAMRPVKKDDARALDSKYSGLLMLAKKPAARPAPSHETNGHAAPPAPGGPANAAPAPTPRPAPAAARQLPSPARGPGGRVIDAPAPRQQEADYGTPPQTREDIPF